MKVTLSVAQFAPELYNKAANVTNILRLIDRAADRKADLVVFGELMTTGYVHESMNQMEATRFLELAEPIPGPATRRIGKKAKEREIFVVVGLCEKRDVPGFIYNSSVLIGADGGIAQVYRKTHLPLEEPHYFVPGSRLEICKTAIGRIGMLICGDMRLPEPTRVLTLKGAQIIVIPAAWPRAFGTRFPILDYWWDVYPSVRASENGVFLIAANRVGKEKALDFYGHSKIVNCQGATLAECGEDEEVKVATVDLNEIDRHRIFAVALRARNPSLYKLLSEPLQ